MTTFCLKQVDAAGRVLLAIAARHVLLPHVPAFDLHVDGLAEG
jgi:hypothetical protein